MDPAAVRTARSYYAAIDQLLASGDSSQLSWLLDDRFEGRSTGTDRAIEKESLIDQLHLLRSIEPDARVRTEITSATDDTVTAQVEMVGLKSTSFAGIVLLPERGRIENETLRVRDGKVVERWGAPLAPIPFSEVVATTLPLDSERTTTATLRRWTLGQQSSVHGTSPVPLLIVVLSESISLDIALPTTALLAMGGRAGSSDRAFADIRSTPVLIGEGSTVLLPPGTEFTLRNALDQEVLLIAVEFTTSLQKSLGPMDHTGAFSTTLLARGVAIGSELETLTVAVARLRLEPGHTWRAERISGGGELVAVLNGKVHLQAETGLIWTADDQALISSHSAVTIPAMEGAAIDGATEVTYQVSGGEDVEAWVVALAPAS